MPSSPATKFCPKCMTEKSVDDFRRDAGKADGRHSYCIECQNEYQKSYHEQNGDRIRAGIKARREQIKDMVRAAKSQPCTDCGLEYPLHVMDLDHVRGEKKFNLSVAGNKGRSLETVAAEIAKCEPVCANCHRIRTFNRSNGIVGQLDRPSAF